MVREAAKEIVEQDVEVLYVAPRYMDRVFLYYLQQSDIEIVPLTYESDFDKIDFSNKNFAIATTRTHHIPFYKQMTEKLNEETFTSNQQRKLQNISIFYSK